MSAKHQGAQFKHKFSSLGPRWTVECHSRLLLENHPWSELPESMGSPVKALPFLPPLGQWCRTASPLSTAYMGSYDSCFFCLFGFSFPFLLSLPYKTGVGCHTFQSCMNCWSLKHCSIIILLLNQSLRCWFKMGL